MKLLPLLLALGLLTGCSTSTLTSAPPADTKKADCMALIESGASEAIIAQRGCCSWHGGVCGCDSYAGRLRCCDGELSPSCGC